MEKNLCSSYKKLKSVLLAAKGFNIEIGFLSWVESRTDFWLLFFDTPKMFQA